MTVYEVTLAVDADVAEAYADWLGAHIPEVVAAGGFERADWLAVTDAPDDGRTHWVVQYHAARAAVVEAYLAGPAAALRDEALQRFGGRFAASRRVLAPVREPGGTTGPGRPR